jgi:hypothetical protein
MVSLGVTLGFALGSLLGPNGSRDEEEEEISVGTDGPSAVYVPASAADWVELGLPAPLAQWNCQDASGNLTAAVGAIELVPNASPLYQQTVSGWTRNFVGTADGTASQRFSTSDASLDAGAGVSMAMLVYMAWDSASARRLFIAGGDNNTVRSVASTGVVRSFHNGTGVSSATDLGDTTVRPYIWYRNATSNASGLLLISEALVGTHDETATSGAIRGIGAPGANIAATSKVGLMAYWTGADAETIAAKATLTTLGWTVAW